MRGIKKFIPYASESDILKINFDVDDEDLLFALVWSTASFLSSLWNLRVEKKRISLSKISISQVTQGVKATYNGKGHISHI